jgi:hypothetical protein
LKCHKKIDGEFGFYCEPCWSFHFGHAAQWWGLGKSNLHLRCKACRKVLTDGWKKEACSFLSKGERL